MRISTVCHWPSESYDARSNLLKALRPHDIDLLQPKLQCIRLRPRQVLYEPGDHVGYVYFPCGPSLLSFIVTLESGKEVEIALIGREGAVGGIVSHGRLPAYARTIVQFEGVALRMECSDLERAKFQSPTLRAFFSRYADCLLAQIFQTVACNAAHSIEQRAAKWLLAATDRIGDSEISLTQEQLAGMLGVGRSYVARVIKGLEIRGLLKLKRRRLCILDHNGLMAASCDCNASVRRHFDEVLGGVYPGDDDEAVVQGS